MCILVWERRTTVGVATDAFAYVPDKAAVYVRCMTKNWASEVSWKIIEEWLQSVKVYAPTEGRNRGIAI